LCKSFIDRMRCVDRKHVCSTTAGCRGRADRRALKLNISALKHKSASLNEERRGGTGSPALSEKNTSGASKI